MNESIPKNIDTKEEALHRELDAFIARGAYTAEELKDGYYLALNPKGTATIRTLKIADEIRRLVGKGYPIHRFEEHLDIARNAEISTSEFESMVQKLEISEEEKGLLVSIAKESRVGTLTLSGDGKEIMKIGTDLYRDQNYLENATMLQHNLTIMLREAYTQDIEKLSFEFKED